MTVAVERYAYRPQPKPATPAYFAVEKRVTKLAQETLELFFGGIIDNPRGYVYTARPCPSALTAVPAIWNNMMKLLDPYPQARLHAAKACGFDTFMELKYSNESPLHQLLTYKLNDEQGFEGATAIQFARAEEGTPISKKPFFAGQMIKAAPTPKPAVNPTRVHNASTLVMNAALSFIKHNSYTVCFDWSVRNEDGSLIPTRLPTLFPKECRRNDIIAVPMAHTDNMTQDIVIIDLAKLGKSKMTYDDVPKEYVRKYTRAEFQAGQEQTFKRHSSKDSLLFKFCYIIFVRMCEPNRQMNIKHTNENTRIQNHVWDNWGEKERVAFWKKMLVTDGPVKKAFEVVVKR